MFANKMNGDGNDVTVSLEQLLLLDAHILTENQLLSETPLTEQIFDLIWA